MADNYAGFGICPFCGSPLGWGSDSEHWDDERLIVRYLSCQTCGASVEAVECPIEERENYPYYQEHKVVRKGFKTIHIPTKQSFISIAEACRVAHVSYKTIKKSPDWKICKGYKKEVIQCDDGIHGNVTIEVTDEGQMHFS